MKSLFFSFKVYFLKVRQQSHSTYNVILPQNNALYMNIILFSFSSIIWCFNLVRKIHTLMNSGEYMKLICLTLIYTQLEILSLLHFCVECHTFYVQLQSLNILEISGFFLPSFLLYKIINISKPSKRKQRIQFMI